MIACASEGAKKRKSAGRPTLKGWGVSEMRGHQKLHPHTALGCRLAGPFPVVARIQSTSLLQALTTPIRLSLAKTIGTLD